METISAEQQPTTIKKQFANLVFDLKIYDREAGFKKRGDDPGNKERKAVTKRTGLTYKELDEVMVAIRSKY